MMLLLITLLVTNPSLYHCGRVGGPIVCHVVAETGEEITIHVDALDSVTGIATHVVVDLPLASYDLGDGTFDGVNLWASDGSVTLTQTLKSVRLGSSGRLGGMHYLFWTDKGGMVETL